MEQAKVPLAFSIFLVLGFWKTAILFCSLSGRPYMANTSKCHLVTKAFVLAAVLDR